MITKKWLKDRIEHRDSIIKNLDNQLIEADKLSAENYKQCKRLQEELTELKINYANVNARYDAYKKILKLHPVENTDTIYIDGKIYKVSGYTIRHDANCAETVTVDATRLPEVVPV